MVDALDSVIDPRWVEYGVEGAIFLVAIIILLVLYGLISHSNKRFQKDITDRLNARDQALIARQKAQDKRAEAQDEKYSKTLEALIKGQSHIHSPEEENLSSKFANFVHLELEKLVRETHCSRAYFVIYHNGVWSNNGISLPKMSMINEAVATYGIESIMPQLQSIPRSFLPSIDNLFLKDGKVFYRDVENFREKDPMSYSWLASHGCKAFVMIPVKDVTKEYFIGFIGIEYYSEMPADLADRQVKSMVTKTAASIAAAACFTDEDEKMAAGLKTARRGPHA